MSEEKVTLISITSEDPQMILWECQYDLLYKTTGEITTWKDYWWGTTPITISTIVHHWEIIHPGGYMVSNFTCKRAVGEIEKPYPHIIKRG